MALKKYSRPPGPLKKKIVKTSTPSILFTRKLRSFLKKIILVLSSILIISILVGSSWFIYSGKARQKYHGVWQQIYAYTQQKGLETRHIYISGFYYTEAPIYEKILTKLKKKPLLQVHLPTIRKELQKLPWVKHAVVERELPDILHIKIEEKRPIALWQNKGKYHIIDSEGALISDVSTTSFSNFIVMTGEDAPVFAPSLLQLLSKEPSFLAQISTAQRISQQRWTIKTKKGVEIKFPHQDMENAWHTLMKIYKEPILWDDKVRSIDLRSFEKFYIKRS